MEILDLLRKIGMNESEIVFFEGGYVLRPRLIKKDNSLLLALRVKQALPFEVWLKCQSSFKESTHMEVALRITCEKCDLSAVDVRQYITYFDAKNKKFFYNSLIPKVMEDSISLTYRNEEDLVDRKGLDDLSKFLNLCGLSHSIDKYEKVEIVPSAVPNEKRQIIAYATENNNYYPKKADTKKSIYLPMANIEQEVENVYLQGQVFSVDSIKSRKDREIQTFMMNEGDDAFTFKRFEGRRWKKEDLAKIKVGDYLRCYGAVKYDTYSNELSMLVDEVMPIDAPKAKSDDASRKRVELHAHTNKSEMDGVCECSDLVKRAFDYGHKAVTVMDNMVVQAYPDAQRTHLRLVKNDRDYDFKVIYGIEMNMVDEKANIVLNPNDNLLKDETFVVFDLETTGLSCTYDEIIEFGAVKVINGVIVDRLQSFIKPSLPISVFTENFTGITQADVEDAPTIAEIMPEIIDFIGNSTLVAHNAEFDYGFMNESLRKLDQEPIYNPVIDTLPFSWVLFPERKRYALGYLVRGYEIEYDAEAAHRADYDAEVLAQAFTKMLQTSTSDTMTLQDLQSLQTNDIYKKIFSKPVSIIAKNSAGIKSIYELVTLSHTKYLVYSEQAVEKGTNSTTEPRILRSEILKRKENLLIGSCCYNSELFEIAANRSQTELVECMKFYDYVEIQPLDSYCKLLEKGSSFDESRLKSIITNIITTAKNLGKVVVATSDAHYLDEKDKLIRDIYISAQRIGGVRHPLYDRHQLLVAPNQHFRTTADMLSEYEYLGETLAFELVVDNSNLICDQVEKVFPIQEELFTPSIEGCEELLAKEIYDNAYQVYGNPLPKLVESRIKKELGSVTKHGFSVQYYIAHLLVKRSNENGYVVGSRGSVGSSFIATMAKITEVNPLVPHYICPKCQHSEFFENGEYSSGFDLPEKCCPVCGELMKGDGHSIPFETFLGFEGDKVPDIDLNFSGDYQDQAQLQVKEIFGDTHVFAAGTIGTVAKKTAFGYIKGYCETKNVPYFSKAKMEYIASKCEGVKRTTGQHPGGIVVCPKDMEIHDFTPVQFPSNDPSKQWMTTHYSINDIHDNILKLDILGHVDPTAIKLLYEMSGINPVDVPIHDEKTMSLFNSTDALNFIGGSRTDDAKTGAVGLPEFGTSFVRGILDITKPTTFAELVSLSGLTHGTDVWLNNANNLIKENTCTLAEVIGCRDDIMVYLIQKGLPPKKAFDIMESVRRGKGVTDKWEELMLKHDVPMWYVDSCRKIKYMFPKAHAVAYVMMAVRIAWFKAHKPEYYYAVFFSCRCDAYEITTMIRGEDRVRTRIGEINNSINANDRSATNKDKAVHGTLEVTYEMMRRGYFFRNISIMKSEAITTIVDPLDNHYLIPHFTTIDGLGANIAHSIVKARNEKPFLSIEDLMQRTFLTNTLLQVMREMGMLDGLPESNQLSLF